MRITLPVIALLAGFVAMPVAPAVAQDSRDAVHDERANFVQDKRGNCVRTRWTAGLDECAPKQVVTVVEQQRRVLNQEERTVYFDFDKATLTAEGTQKLNTLAETLRSDKGVREARIVGFADRMGSTSYNDRLSQRRAKAVQDYLTARGVINSRVTETRWLGKSAPITTCAEDLARAEKISCLQRDRRVEVEVDYVTKAN